MDYGTANFLIQTLVFDSGVLIVNGSDIREKNSALVNSLARDP